jgi:hypothetical protein
MQLKTSVRVVCRKLKRSNHANLRENRCDIRRCWRNRGQQYGARRSLVRPSSSPLRLSSSLLPSSPLRLPPSSLLRLLSSPPPPSPLRLVPLLKGTNFQGRCNKWPFFHGRIRPRDVRFESGTDIPRASRDVRFIPQSGRRSMASRGPLCAASRHRRPKSLR